VRDTKLLNVFDRIVFKDSQDFLGLLPKELDEYFTNKVLALKLGISVRLAQKITYCLKKMYVISIVGKKRNELVFQVSRNLLHTERAR
jgi:mRNA-degrading endonuclease HigB of HigAB toxin-antitoxin module